MLPAINWTNATLNMAVIADDGAQVYLNGSLVATVNLASGVTNLPAITNPSLFQAGTNTLVFYVVNTGNQHYGSPVGRGGAGDCMYVEFSGSVSYFPVPVPVLDIFRAVGLQWVSLTSQSYQVQTSMDMSSWTNFDGVISTPPGTTNTVFDSAEQQQKFYRLLVQ
jgi:hypothetical protein